MSEHNTFDPSRYLTKVGAADYLQVMWRIVWFREQCPNGSIVTELVDHKSNEYAVFKASVYRGKGEGSATGYGSETMKDFRDYLEKAETKAVGRALAMLGFGTQFSAYEFGGEHEAGRIVDSPVDFASMRGRRQAAAEDADYRQQGELPPRGRSTTQNTVPGEGQPATPRQIAFIKAIAKEHGMSDDELGDELDNIYSKPLDKLDRRDASAFIERLQSRRTVTSVS